MWHPYDHLSSALLRRLVSWGTVSMIALAVVLLWVLELGPGLDALGDLVLAGTPERALAALSTWSTEDRIRVAFVAGLDFLFGIVWTNTAALACIWASRRLPAHRDLLRCRLVYLARNLAKLRSLYRTLLCRDLVESRRNLRGICSGWAKFDVLNTGRMVSG